MAFSALGATLAAVGGGAAVTAAVALTAISQVGLIMGVVGAVTGSKTLTKLGGVLGLVGGVGALANGALSGAGAAGAAAGEAATDAALAGAAPAATDAAEFAAMDFVSPVDTATGATLGTEAANVAAPLESTAAIGLSAPIPGTVPDQTVKAVDITGQGASVAPTGPGANTQLIGNDVQERAANLGPQGATGPNAPVGAVGPASQVANQSSGSFLGSIGDWAQKNPTAAALGGKAVLGALSGIGTGQQARDKLQLQKDAMSRANSSAIFPTYTPPPSIYQQAKA